MAVKFDYSGAKEAGYSDEEIMGFLSEEDPNFDVQGALQAGYSPEEINDHMLNYKPERSLLEKTARLGGQLALGRAEMLAWPYEVGVLPLALPGGQETLGNLFTKDILSEVYPEEPGEYKFYQPEQELKEPINLGIRALAEKATGLDLHPEGILEKAASWIGFLKKPTNITKLKDVGLNPKKLLDAVGISGTDITRGLSAGTALQMAEEGDFGPIGTMAAVIAGDLIGGGVAGIGKGVGKLITEPKKTVAEVAAKFTKPEKLELQKKIIKDFRDVGIEADLGTITDSNLIKWTQSRLAQSGLVGKELEEFGKRVTDQIEKEYKSIADGLGEYKLSTNHEAGTVVKETIKKIRDADLAETRSFYEAATKALTEQSSVNPTKLVRIIENIEKELKPGQIKSTEQQTVLRTLENLKRDVTDSQGNVIYAKVKDLMNNKIALNDIINYEVQGGTKQLLKGVVGELDRAIISHGKENPKFARNYIKANQRFAEHAKTYRNRNVNQILSAADPAQLINKMNSVQGIHDLQKSLSKTAEGRKVFNDLKRLKLDQMIGNNLTDSTSQQAKLGTFSKLLEKGKNKEIAKEILGPQAYKRLERLQKNAGKLADASQKFYNASKSGVVAADAAVLAKGMGDIAHILMGNPWPLVKTVGSVVGTRKLANLLADPEFLKLTEDIILAHEKGSAKELSNAFEKVRPYILQAMQNQSSD